MRLFLSLNRPTAPIVDYSDELRIVLNFTITLVSAAVVKRVSFLFILLNIRLRSTVITVGGEMRGLQKVTEEISISLDLFSLSFESSTKMCLNLPL